MKNTKKLLGLILALVLMVSLAVPAFADDAKPYSIQIANDKTSVSIAGKTFSAYKIFSATYNETTQTIAYSYDDTCLGVSYTVDGTAKSGNELLTWLSAQQSNTDAVRAFADHVYETYINQTLAPAAAGSATASGETATIGLESAGYYLVYGSGEAVDGNSLVTAAVSLTSAGPNQIVNPKFDAPTLSKDIWHDDKNATDTTKGDWDVVGDFAIGDTVQFRTISSVPDTYGYSSYTYVIHDTMQNTLTPNKDIKVQVQKKDQTALTDLNNTHYKVDNTPTDGCTFDLSIDIKAAGLVHGDTIYVTYSAVLNENAILYTAGPQANEAYLEYSNNPYTTGTGKTTKDTVYAWTYSMGVNKVDNSETPKLLTGAEFVLSNKANLDISALGVITNGVPANHDDLIGLVATTNGYRPAKVGEDATYVMTAGSITIEGLNDATDYYLYEIKAPAGYNLKTEPVHFRINADYTADGSQKAEGSPTVTIDKANSNTLSTNIVNQSGTVLPTTGGMGTTIFYILGGVLVAAAVVLLITRKRMSSES